jgi:hypothetical protein
MNCNHSMEYISTNMRYFWDQHDILSVEMQDKYECNSCGHTEEVESANSWLCENPN